MGDPRHRLGLDAERTVAAWLTARGWTIRGRRVRSAGGGEVDIVARDPSGVLVAVEVRARRSARSGDAASSVDDRRIARLARTLAAVAASDPAPCTGLRIDVVTVEPEDGAGRRWRLRHVSGVR